MFKMVIATLFVGVIGCTPISSSSAVEEDWQRFSTLVDDSALYFDANTIEVNDNTITVDMWARRFREKARFEIVCGCNGNETREHLAVAKIGTNNWREVDKEPEETYTYCSELSKSSVKIEFALMAINANCTAEELRQLREKNTR